MGCNITGKNKELLHKIASFTLAEVLITLTIIGIIAAITVPTLISKYQKQAAVTRLKKSYALLSTAVSAAAGMNGSVASWDWARPNLITKDYIAPNLKVKKVYENDPANWLCGKDYSWPRGPVIVPPITCIMGNPNQNSFELEDGTCFHIDPGKIVSVDINGSAQKPNVAGKDLFFFRINDNGSVSPLADYSCPDSFASWSHGVGGNCAARIIKDGWKITYNWW